jgi:hypothetical protein
MKLSVSTIANTLRFTLTGSDATGEATPVPAIIDIGEQGRLIGLELELNARGESAAWTVPTEENALSHTISEGVAYIAVESAADAYTRSARAIAALRADAAGRLVEITVPRRGPGYEITYPSGNR